MTHTQDDLSDLLNALLPAEKRYIRICAGKHLHDKENKYLQLFESILEADGESTFQGTASDRNYLFQFVLKAMRSFHEKRNVDVELKELLINSSFLLEKRLYRAGTKMLHRAKNLAEKFGRSNTLLEIIQMETLLQMEHAEKKPVEVIHAIHTKALQTIGEISSDYSPVMIQQHVLMLWRTRTVITADEQEQVTTQLNHCIRAAKTSGRFDPLHHALFASALCRHYLGEYSASAEIYEELIAHWETRPDRVKEESTLYKRVVSNYLIVCNSLERFEQFPVMLEKMNTLPCRNVEEEAIQFQHVKLMELLYLVNTDGYDRLDHFAAELESKLHRFRNKINKARELEFYHGMAVAYFINDNWRSSMEWLVKIINAGKTAHRPDLQLFARVFRMLLWYEMGKYDLLEYEPINVERLLRKQNGWTLLQSQLVRFISNLIVAGKESNLLFQKFMEQLKQYQGDPKFKHTLGMEELRYWVMSHVENRSMREIIREENLGKEVRETA